jgi:predicted TIM-barrel fold metal-dependent hydrolase
VIVDCHCHAGKGELLTAPWTTDAPLGLYLRRARAAGIGRTVIMPTFATNSARANAELARIVRHNPRRFIGLAWIHPRKDAGRVERLVREALRLGLRGIKVHAHDAPPTRELCAVAERYGLPVLVDVYSRAHTIDMFAPEFRRVPFIVAHLGSFADDWRAHQTVVDCLVRHPNVFADTSGVRRFDYLVEAVQRAGARKLLFGSDGPWLHPGVELYKVRLLRLAPADERLVLGGNAMRLFAPSNLSRPWAPSTNSRSSRSRSRAIPSRG